MGSETTTTIAQHRNIIARIERVPYTFWHVKMRLIVGVATFFDAFDALCIAYVLPVLAPMWELSATQIGLLISIGYAGQIAGAFLFGWIAERFGRKPALIGAVAIMGVMSLLCATAGSYTQLLVFRTIQGVGLGGEVPVAAAYINELTKAHGRGKFILLYELCFVVGLVMASLLGYWIVPHIGWKPMFLIGGIPAIVLPIFFMQLPESPRWLAAKLRLAEADAALARIERIVSNNGAIPLAPPDESDTIRIEEKATDWRELFQGTYRKRTFTIWVIWFCSYFVTYGLTTWLPSLYSRVYGLSLSVSLQNSLITQAVGFFGALACALLIDKVGRKTWFVFAFIGSSLFMFLLFFSGAKTPDLVVVYASLCYMFNGSISLALYLYSPEIYPTRMRALGSSIGTVWLRIASVIGPTVTGAIVASYSVANVFVMFAIVALVGAVVTGAFAIETKGKILEQVSP